MAEEAQSHGDAAVEAVEANRSDIGLSEKDGTVRERESADGAKKEHESTTVEKSERTTAKETESV